MKRLLSVLATIMCLAITPSVTATHFSGGEITYTCVGVDSFLVTLRAFRDCSGIPAPGAINMTFASTCGGNFTSNFPLTNVGGTEVSQLCATSIPQSTCNGGLLPGMEEYVYQNTVVLSPRCDDWTANWSQCCRNTSLNVAGSPQMSISTVFRSQTDTCNASPIFTSQPIPYTCINQPVNYNYGAVDSDGDSLVYSLVSAQSASGVNVGYVFPNTAANPIPGITLNQNGQLSFTPTLTGNYIVVVQVDEYDPGTGALLGNIRRDIQFVVENCGNNVPSAPTSYTNTTGTATFTPPTTVTANPGQNFCFDVVFTDPNLADNITLTSNAATVLPGGTFTQTGTNPATGTICWTAVTGVSQSLSVSVFADDGACPVFGTNSQSFEIIVPANVLSATLGVTDVTCFGNCDGTATATIASDTSGNTYTYAWSNGTTTFGGGTSTLTGLCPGAITVFVTENPSGETFLVNPALNISEPGPLFFTLDTINGVSCNGDCTGSVSVLAVGGSSPLTYAWDDPGNQIGTTASNLCAGTYNVLVTDANGCTITRQYTIVDPPAVVAVIDSSNNVSCSGGNDGEAFAGGYGGSSASTSTLTYRVDQTGTFSPYTGTGTAFALGSGSLDDGVSTAMPLGFTFEFFGQTFTQVFASTNGFITFNASSPNGCCTGQVLPNAGAPNNLIAYAWEDLNLGAGGTIEYWTAGASPNRAFIFNVTDQPHFPNGNLVTTQIVLHETSNIIEIHTTSAPSDGGNHTMGIEDATGANGFFVAGRNSSNWGTITNDYVAFVPEQALSFSWPSGGTNANETGLTAGIYCVTVTDANGCTDTACVNIADPAPITTTFTNTDASCNGTCDGVANAAVAGGTSPYTFNWSSGGSSASESGLCAGTYTLTVTDANGCTNTFNTVIAEPSAIGILFNPTAASCNGTCDGSITTTVTGGSPAYTFAWSNGNTGATINGLCAGTYTVTVTDNNGCTQSANATITEPTAVSASITNSTNVSCLGGNDGTATAGGSGGTASYTFAWPSGGSAATETGLIAGVYCVTVTDNNGCTDTACVSISQPANGVDASITSSTNVTCFGGNDGSATAGATGGTAPYTFAWPGGGNSATENGLSTGTFCVTVTDNNGCSDTACVTIGQPANPVAATIIATTPASCNGAADGSASAGASGGTTPYTFAWPSGGSGGTEGSLAAGTYCVTVTDANGCTDTACAIITEPATVVASITTSSNVSCNGAADGSATAAAAGGSAPYTFSWSTGGSAATVTGLGAGSFTVTVTDANGCTDTESVSITEPTPVAVSITSSTNVSCNGGNDGTIDAAGSGGTAPYTFNWSSGATSSSIAGLTAGNYTVTVTDANGCTDQASISITQPASAVVASASLTSNVNCFGGNDGSATAGGSGGTAPYTFAWPSGGSNALETGLSAGQVCVTVTDANGCSDTACVNITQPATGVDAAIIATTPASCNGATDGSASAGASGGNAPYTFAWPSGGSNPLESNLAAGTYCVTVTDANGCTDTACAIVNEPAAVVASILTSTDVSCFGFTDGAATAAAAGGSSPYTFVWSNAATTASISSLTAGTYSVTVTDANGCTDSTSVVISEPAPLVVFVATLPASCAGICDGTASATVSGGTLPYTLAWPAGSPVNVCAGSYILTVTDGNGCTLTSPYTITSPAPIVTSITNVSNASCNGVCDGSATVAVTSGGTAPFTFNWSNGAIGTSPSNLCAGVNRVTVTDANGCPAVDSVTITEPAPINIAITTTDATCFGLCDGTANAAVTGGTAPYALFWPGGSNVNICAGTYTMTVVDFNGCTDSATYTISEPAQIVVAITSQTDASCNGVCDGSATVGVAAGGTGPFTFNWSNGTTGPADNSLCAGNYTITVTDANGCTETTNVTITEPTLLVASVVVDNNVSCGGLADGGVTASAAGGTPAYTFNWSNGATNASLTGLVAGTYTVTVTDANGCTSVDSATVTEPAVIVTSIINVTNALCNGQCNGTATATVASGGTAPFTFQWSNGGVAAQDTSLCAGMNFVTVTDANGCSAVDSVNITEPSSLSTSVTTTNATCSGICDGLATANVTGGTAPYALFWPGGSNVNLCAGSYVLTVVDFNGCTDTASYVITQPSTLIPGFTNVNDASCNGICDGTATAGLTSGGTAPFTFNWSNGASTSALTGLCAGNYTVTISDANGCSVVDSVTINEPALLAVTVAVDSNVFCPGQATGGVSAAIVGGTTPYTFNWSNGGTATFLSGITAGTYTVTVTDANGCTGLDSATVTEPAPIVSNVSGVTNASCNGTCDGSATVAVTSGGTAPFTFNWSNGATGTNPTNLCAGTNTVTITDANGCTSVDNAVITEPAAISITVTTTNASCNGICDGTASAVAGGGTAPYTIQWPAGNNTNICAGTYMVTVTDANGCSDSAAYTITEPAIIDLAFSNVNNASCSGNCDGSATVGVNSGGTAPFTFAWSNGTTTSFDTALCAGTTTVTVTDANGCTAVDSVTITQPGGLTINTISQDATCSGICDGAGILIVAGGTPNYTYAWPSGASTPVDTGLCAGTYIATVTDAAGCSITATVTIGQPIAITTSIGSVTNASCNGVCDGSATVTASNGTTPYTFSWSNGETSATAVALCAGMNFVTVTDSNQCSAVDSIMITEPAGANITIVATDPSCNGTCDGTITTTAVGGTTPYTFNWSNGTGTANLTGLCAGVYTLTLTDANGCTQTAQQTIMDPAPITLSFTGVTTAQCNGVCNGSATANASAGTAPYTYNWANGVTGAVNNTLCAGFNVLTVTDANNCTTVDSILIVDPNAVTINVIPSDPTCFGSCDGAALALVFGGTFPYTYAWPSGSSLPIDTNLCAGNYTVTVTDNNGCFNVANFSINQPPPIVTAITGVGPISCGSTCDGTATASVVSGGLAPFTFVWSNGVNNAANTTLCAGMNFVTVTDVFGCTTVDSVNIVAPGALTLSVSSTNASCNGVCDGTATATVTGGTTPYTFNWSNGASSANLTALCAGAYTVTITDASGCTLTDSVLVTEPSPIVLNPNVIQNASCFGICDGAAQITVASGGTAPFAFSWSNGTAGPLDTALCAGTYTITVSDGFGCTATTSLTITEPPTITGSIIATNVLCNGVCNGTATTNIFGGSTPYTYAWSNGSSAANLNGLCGGTYTLTLTDANGCTFTDSAIIIEPSPILTSMTLLNSASCGGICDGAAVVAVNSGGTAPFTFLWSNGGSANLDTNLCAGLNFVTVTDGNGCTVVDSINITGPNALTLNLNSTPTSCPGICDGSATAVVTGGVTPYTYLWNTGAITPAINGLCAGTYTVTMTDSTGCFIIDSVTVVEPGALILAFSGVTNTTCNNTCDGAAAVSVASGGTAPFTFNWSTGTTGNFDTLLCAGTYTVTVTDANGCTGLDSVSIINPNLLVVSSVVNNNASCFGQCDGSATIVANGGTAPYTFNWSNGNSTDTDNALCAGTYGVTVTDANGCFDTLSVTITEPGAIFTSIVNVTNASCNGVCDGAAEAIVNSGGTAPFNFTWSNGNTGSVNIALCAGMNFVTVSDANGCTTVDSVMIIEPPVLLANVSGSNMSCGNICDAFAAAAPTGGTAPYTYAWSTGQTTDTLFNLCAGTYDVTVSDANGCTAVGSHTVNSPTPIVANQGSVDANCGVCDGVAFVAPTGGNAPYTYAWSTGGSTTDSLTGLCAGLYTVTITDASGCTIADTISVNNFLPNLVVVDSVVDVTCFGGNDGSAAIAVLSGATPPLTYLWNDPNAQTTPIASNLTAGPYIVQVTDASGCIFFRNITVNQPDTLIVQIAATNPSCNGDNDGSATVTSTTGGTPPYTYTWTNLQAGTTATNLGAGLIGVVVQDANGCLGGDSITLIDPPVITASASVQAQISCPGSCDGELTVTPLGGTPPYVQFEWQDLGGTTVATTPTATGLCAGTYFVTVTDTNGCTAVDSLTIVDPPGMITSVSVLNAISCNGNCDGVLSVGVNGGTPGYSFLWSNGDTSAIADTLCAGQYFVTVTDANGCTIVDSMMVTQPTAVTLANVSVTSSNCGACDGQISVLATGGTGAYTYDWGNGQTTATAINLCAGVYNLTITDSVGCAFTFPIPLSDTGGANIAVNTTDAGCNGSCDGSATVVATGGAVPYTYLWSNGDTATLADSLCAGGYSITVTDSAGCITVDTTTVNEPAPFTLSFTTTPLACNGACIATASVATSGGAAPYTYLWNTGDTTSTISGLCSGTYTVTVTEANGCTAVDSTSIIQPAVFNVVLNSNNISCFGNNDGSITLTTTGGVAPYAYNWSNGDTTAVLTGLSAGTYTVTASDAGGCSDTLSVIITEPSQITATNAVQSPSCGGSNGIATINPIGGVPFTVGAPYLYQWDDPLNQTNQTAANLSAAIYNVTVTDSIGCFDVFQVIVNDSGSGVISIDTVTQVSCPGDCDGAIDITVTAGQPVFTYNWAGPAGFSDSLQDIDSLCAGTYTVTATGANGCQSFEIINLPDPSPLVFASFDLVNPSCGGDSDGQITAHVTGGTQPYTFAWSNLTVSQDSTLVGLTAGTYSVTVTDANGCTQLDSATIVEPLPIVVVVDTVIDATCSNSNDGSVQISVSGGSAPYTYQWISGTDSTIAGTNQDLVNVLPAVYQLLVVDSAGCEVFQNITVNASTIVTANAPNDTTLCSGGGSLTLVGSATSNTGFSVQWLDTSGAIVSNSDTLTVSPTGNTQYVYIVSSGLCTDADTVVVNVASPVVASAGTNVSIVSGGQATLGGSPTGPVNANFNWTPSNNLDNASAANPVATPDSTTTYVVTVTSPEGCTDVDTVTVTVIDVFDVVNAFTPNGDGVNDVWIISILADYPNARVEIFNRWGQSLFQSNGYTIPWDGTFEGNDLPIGTYYYTIDLGDSSTDPIVGTITIVR